MRARPTPHRVRQFVETFREARKASSFAASSNSRPCLGHRHLRHVAIPEIGDNFREGRVKRQAAIARERLDALAQDLGIGKA